MLVDYMYTGYLGVNLAVIGPLLMTSKLLGMDDVVQCCCMHLLGSLSVNNWPQVGNRNSSNKNHWEALCLMLLFNVWP